MKITEEVHIPQRAREPNGSYPVVSTGVITVDDLEGNLQVVVFPGPVEYELPRSRGGGEAAQLKLVTNEHKTGPKEGLVWLALAARTVLGASCCLEQNIVRAGGTRGSSIHSSRRCSSRDCACGTDTGASRSPDYRNQHISADPAESRGSCSSCSHCDAPSPGAPIAICWASYATSETSSDYKTGICASCITETSRSQDSSDEAPTTPSPDGTSDADPSPADDGPSNGPSTSDGPDASCPVHQCEPAASPDACTPSSDAASSKVNLTIIQAAPTVYRPPVVKPKEVEIPEPHLPPLLEDKDQMTMDDSLIGPTLPEVEPPHVEVKEEGMCDWIMASLGRHEVGEVIAEDKKKSKQERTKRCIRTAAGISWEDPSLLEWEHDDFRIFCGDLGNEVNDDILARAFSKYQSFLKAKVIRDKRTGKTKGYGFVSFKDPNDYVRAMREMNGKYVGSRPIKLRKSMWRDRNLDVVRKKQKEKKKLGLR
ncbi:RNA-binding protein 42-like [Scyliorhinus canicula]|uniref:RNA-binding protein 42-like n=1 Tax=Scyliorhinus canicula TaxID=7830 RepID=UPI0018F2B938|nr:RNA-binding protein 42-like [Scyliorhinus canicula]